MFASYAGCDEILSVSFLTVSIAAHGLNSAGAVINLFDLGPNYVAPVNAIINTFGTIVGMIAPYVAGILTPNVSFKMVFYFVIPLIFFFHRRYCLNGEWCFGLLLFFIYQKVWFLPHSVVQKFNIGTHEIIRYTLLIYIP